MMLDQSERSIAATSAMTFFTLALTASPTGRYGFLGNSFSSGDSIPASTALNWLTAYFVLAIPAIVSCVLFSSTTSQVKRTIEEQGKVVSRYIPAFTGLSANAAFLCSASASSVLPWVYKS